MAGKGDTPRPVDKKKYDEGYERVFGKKKPYTPLDMVRDFPEMLEEHIPDCMAEMLDELMKGTLKDRPIRLFISNPKSAKENPFFEQFKKNRSNS